MLFFTYLLISLAQV